MNHLEALRRNFGRCLIPALWAHVPVLAGTEAILAGGLPPLAPIAAVAILAATVTLLWLKDPVGPATWIVSGLALIGMAAIFVATFAGHSWQIDLHMYFFACLAVLFGRICRRNSIISGPKWTVSWPRSGRPDGPGPVSVSR